MFTTSFKILKITIGCLSTIALTGALNIPSANANDFHTLTDRPILVSGIFEDIKALGTDIESARESVNSTKNTLNSARMLIRDTKQLPASFNNVFTEFGDNNSNPSDDRSVPNPVLKQEPVK